MFSVRQELQFYAEFRWIPVVKLLTESIFRWKSLLVYCMSHTKTILVVTIYVQVFRYVLDKFQDHDIQGVSGEIVNILGGGNMDYSE